VDIIEEKPPKQVTDRWPENVTGEISVPVLASMLTAARKIKFKKI